MHAQAGDPHQDLGRMHVVMLQYDGQSLVQAVNGAVTEYK